MDEETVRKNSVKAWILAARPKTLSGAAVPVLIALSLAWSDGRDYEASEGGSVFQWAPALLCLLFAWIMQIDANFINDFFDFARGNDNAATRLGPKRACAEGWVSIDAMERAIAITTIAACAVGLPLVYWGGLTMIIVGALCVVFCFLYTVTFSYLGLGDLLVLLFFGLIPVCVTYYIQLHTVTVEVVIASLACGLVIDGLLIVNNYRDRDTDRETGKKTLIVRLGERGGRLFFLYTGMAAWIAGGVSFIFFGHPIAFLLSAVYPALHFITYLNIKRINSGRELNRCLGAAARNILIYGLGAAVGVLLS